jgi:hypothetical protein
VHHPKNLILGFFWMGWKPTPRPCPLGFGFCFICHPTPNKLALPTSYLHLPIYLPSHLPSFSFTLKIALFPSRILFLFCLPLHYHCLCSFSPFMWILHRFHIRDKIIATSFEGITFFQCICITMTRVLHMWSRLLKNSLKVLHIIKSIQCICITMMKVMQVWISMIKISLRVLHIIKLI